MRSDRIGESLDFVSTEAKRLVLDSLYCELFNLTGDLEGNTAERDIDWLASQIWLRMDLMRERRDFDRLTDDEKDHWRAVARATLEALPLFMSRVVDRWSDHAKVIGTMLHALRSEEKSVLNDDDRRAVRHLIERMSAEAMTAQARVDEVRRMERSITFLERQLRLAQGRERRLRHAIEATLPKYIEVTERLGIHETDSPSVRLMRDALVIAPDEAVVE